MSSPALFRFSPVSLHPKCVKCLDLGGQGMQPGREPALSCPLWWAPESTMHRSVFRPISLGLSLPKMSPWSPSFSHPSELSWALPALWESHAFWNMGLYGSPVARHSPVAGMQWVGEFSSLHKYSISLKQISMQLQVKLYEGIFSLHRNRFMWLTLLP